MIVDRLERGQAADRIVELLGERSAESAIVSTEPIVEEFDVRGRLRAAGVEVFEEVDDDEKLFSAGAGVTGVSHAVAETGSLFLCSGGQSPRQASLVPPMHIAILEEDQIVPDLLDLASALGQFESELPAGMCLVTGPSKSADIELTLVKGVHGPGRQHVILVPPVQP
jgi:L-lactate dehydrogenase complex protein LldG